MRRLLKFLLVLGLIGGGIFWLLTAPRTLDASAVPQRTPDLANGELVFHAGGCASCHAARPVSDCAGKAPDKKVLGGGHCLKTPFGTFVVPNISPDETAGIGRWSDLDFANAMLRGVSPGGAHYYPAFPYASYQRMRMEDVLDLKAYLMTLPKSQAIAPPHDLALPFRLRRGLGVWKALFLDGKPFEPDATKDAEYNRGAYLVEGLAHCGECHSPRNALGGIEASKRLAGGPAPEGTGWIPNLTPAPDGLANWSKEDIASALGTGLLPDGDFLGGSMVSVQENMAKLPASDRLAIAAYLKALPPVANPKPAK